MYCHKCGTELKGDANFCYSCGAKIEEAVEKVIEEVEEIVHEVEDKIVEIIKPFLIKGERVLSYIFEDPSNYFATDKRVIRTKGKGENIEMKDISYKHIPTVELVSSSKRPLLAVGIIFLFLGFLFMFSNFLIGLGVIIIGILMAVYKKGKAWYAIKSVREGEDFFVGEKQEIKSESVINFINTVRAKI